jgi:hypothetical protein
MSCIRGYSHTQIFYRETPLHYAMKGVHISILVVSFLLRHGASINATSSRGNTPLQDLEEFTTQGLIELILM